MSTTKKDMSVEEVRALIVRAIEEKGADYRYQMPTQVDPETGDEWQDCVYVADGQPSCLVGHVLVMAGVPMPSILPYEGTSADATWGSLMDGTPPTTYVRGESSVVAQALWAAQQAQDNGKTWGEALEAFDKTVKRLTEEQA